jgi:hypothetical protein
MRTTYLAGSESMLQRDVTADMVLLEPDTNPLYVMTNNAKQSKASIVPTYEWAEDAEAPLWGQMNNSVALAANATTVTVVDGTIFLAGDLIVLPKANSNALRDELCLVTNVATNVLTITRDVGGLGVSDTIGTNDSIRILGGAFAEGSALPVSRTTQKSVLKSACQIFRTPIEITMTMQATETFMTEDEENFQLGKALQRHRAEIEAAGLWGQYSESATSPKVWTTGGFKSRIVTNVTDMSTTITGYALNQFGETGFRYGSKNKLGIAAPRVLTCLNQIATGYVKLDNAATIFGVRLQRYQLTHGTILLANNFRMEAGIAGKNGFNDEMYLLDLDSIRFRYLAGNGQNRNTKLRVDVVKDGGDYRKSEYYSQVGWQIMHEKRHARFFDVSNYS